MKNLPLIMCVVALGVMLITVVCAAGINDELFKAVSNKDIQKIKELISRGADVNAKEAIFGKTPLMSASLPGDTEVARVLLERGADVNARDNEGSTALEDAAFAGRTETAKLLIEKGADLNARNKDGFTPLFLAISMSKPETAKLLIEKGADVNARDKYGWTPLINAADKGQTAVVKLLIEKGADVNATTNQGRTALKVAEAKGHKDIVALLKKAGAKGGATAGSQAQVTKEKPLPQKGVAKDPQPGAIWKDPVLGMEFVWVPGGCYEMGCGSWMSDCWKFDTEKPVHTVCISGFWMGRYEVTQGQWQRLMGDNPSKFQNCGANCPVEMVLWNEAVDFARRLSQKAGHTFRLPTEAEWEYACRSGGKQEKYSGGDDADAVAWYDHNAGLQTHPVGQKRANSLGIYDMSGNIKEWCHDWYGEEYYGKSPKNNPQGPSSGQVHVLRGGTWIDFAINLRCPSRQWYYQDKRDESIGFRLVRGDQQTSGVVSPATSNDSLFKVASTVDDAADLKKLQPLTPPEQSMYEKVKNDAEKLHSFIVTRKYMRSVQQIIKDNNLNEDLSKIPDSDLEKFFPPVTDDVSLAFCVSKKEKEQLVDLQLMGIFPVRK